MFGFRFQEEKTSMLSEISKMNFTVTPNENKSKETIVHITPKTLLLKQQVCQQ